MILYHLAADDDKDKDSVPSRDSHHHLIPPQLPANLRESTVSSSRSSFISMELDSKYNIGTQLFLQRGVGSSRMSMILPSMS
jgi:hypothetical protein